MLHLEIKVLFGAAVQGDECVALLLPTHSGTSEDGVESGSCDADKGLRGRTEGPGPTMLYRDAGNTHTT